MLFRVQLPLAMSVILAGIRTATVINVGTATLAAFIGAGDWVILYSLASRATSMP